ncbi:MAG: CCA tRNA nucleotidyltransferase [Anaerolineaceae bacterium]|nr:CCA tRNA nucleotidyltransferase [Anaerolineaceae bacterium]
MLKIPQPVLELMDTLENAGFPAYTVGGCVRDSLLNRVPKDWDITTSAHPDRVRQIFRNEKISLDGLAHGTVVVYREEEPYEITTFRKDGAYTDHRHPDSVCFVDDIRDDLVRRDFTVNALAYSPKRGMVDLFHGQKDLENKLIRCIGESKRRFTEDAFRMIRALRFSSVFEFTIEPETAEGIHALCPTLRDISGDRKRKELMKLLCGNGVGYILRSFPDAFSVMIPEIKTMVGYDQNNRHHVYDLWEHTVRAVENTAPDPILRLTMLLHDTGKPATKTIENGECHFRGHPEVSARISQRVLEELSFDRATANRVMLLVENHDLLMQLNENKPDEIKSFLRRKLQTLGEENLRDIIRVNRADRIATGTRTIQQVDEWTQTVSAMLDELLTEKPAFSKNDLALKGDDLKALGLYGAEIGKMQRLILAKIAEGYLKNDAEEIESFIKSQH